MSDTRGDGGRRVLRRQRLGPEAREQDAAVIVPVGSLRVRRHRGCDVDLGRDLDGRMVVLAVDQFAVLGAQLMLYRRQMDGAANRCDRETQDGKDGRDALVSVSHG